MLSAFRPVFRWLLPVVFAATAAMAQSPVLIRNARIFDGVSSELRTGDILVEGDRIARIGDSVDAPQGAAIIEAGGRILTPGFIDLHAHLTLGLTREQLMQQHPWVVGAVTARTAESYLNQGFTTVRDAGGTHPDVARAIEAGWITGPRVYPSGAVVTQTSGHGDLRAPNAPHPILSAPQTNARLAAGMFVIADGVPQTLAAVRENLKDGATQIKIMGGGGVASDYDPIHTLQPSPEEIRAAVQAAGDWGTYVMAHSYTSEAVRRLVDNGVKVIEHGLLIDDETARLCAEKGIVISTQVAIFRMGADLPGLTEENKAKFGQVLAGQNNLMSLIKKYGITTGFGTDMVFGSHVGLGSEFTARADYFEPAQILRQATSESASIVRMAGKLNRHADFGEIREGWLADLLLIEGDPFEDISILEQPDKSLLVIMKDGRVVKNRLVRGPR